MAWTQHVLFMYIYFCKLFKEQEDEDEEGEEDEDEIGHALTNSRFNTRRWFHYVYVALYIFFD